MPLFAPSAGGGIAAQIGGNTSGATALVSSGTMTLAGGDNVTLSQNGNAITISAAAGGTAAGTFSGGISNIGNTVGTSGVVQARLVLAGGNNITLSQSVNGQSATLTISAANETQTVPPIATAVQSVLSANSIGTLTRFAAEDHGHAGLYSINVGGNVAGNTSAGAGSFMLAGGDNVTLSGATGAGGALTLSVVGASGAGGGYKAGISNIGNTSGTTGTVASQLVLAGGNNITLSQSVNGASATLTISQSNPVALYAIPTDFASTTVNLSNSMSTIFFVPLILPTDMTVSRICMLNSGNFQTQTSAANNTTFALTFSRGLAIYSYNGQSLALHTSMSGNQPISWTSNVCTLSMHSVRLHTFPLNATLTPGNWWVAFSYSSSATRSGAATSATTYANSYYYGNGASSIPGVAGIFSAASDTGNRYFPYAGFYSAQSAAFPASIASADLNTGNSVNLWFRLDGAING